MPPIVFSIIALVQAAVAAGPEVAKIYDEAKKLFNWLFGGGIITYEQQQQLMTWADEHMEAVLSGQVPPELVVEPDPTVATPG